jgi:membrane fusion protein, multidrug efflux system
MKYTSTISVILVSGLILSACSSKNKSEASTINKDPVSVSVEKEASPVKVMTLGKTKIARTIEYTATILPYEEVNVAPSTPGRIDKIYVEVGSRVNKGENLFLMDRTQLYQQKVQLASFAKDLARLDTLRRTGSVKEQQYDQMKTQYDVTKTNVDFMEVNTLLKAPFSAVVTGKYFEEGEMYSGSPSSPSGKAAVVTIMQVNPLKVNVGISEQYYPLVKKGMKADILADVYKNETFTATVYRIYPTINSPTRSFNTELELPNRNDMLKPGMFVRVALNLGEVETFVVPSNTVMQQEGTNERFVFLVRDNVAARVAVTLGQRFDDKLEVVSSEIKEGDLLVSDGQAKLINGDKIKISE